MTAYCKRIKVFYMDIPRTGSKGTLGILERYYGAKEVVARRVKPEPGAFIFHTVRDPYSRAISMWNFFLGDVRYPNLKYKECPEETIRWCHMKRKAHSLNQDHFTGFPLVLNQCDHLRFRHNDLKPDAIVHLETYEEDFRRLPFFKNRPHSFPRQNASSKDPLYWKKHLTPGLIDAVNEWAAEDFERFGYEMRTP
jgi:hypothetical protein